MFLEGLWIVEIGEGDSPILRSPNFSKQVCAFEIAEDQRTMAIADTADALSVAGTILVVDGKRVSIAVSDSREVENGTL